MRKKLLAAGSALLLVAGLISLGAGPATAGGNSGDDSVCAGFDSGKIDVDGNHKTLEVTAPAGQLIDGYCIKAGSVEQGLGPVWVSVDPPVATLTISYPNADKDISHYALSYTDVVVPPVDVCTNIDGVQTSVPAGMTADGTTCSTPPTDVCTNIVGVQTEVPAGMTLDGTECVTPPVDVCANIVGVQTTVPADMVQVGAACLPFQLPPMAVVTPTVVSNNITCTAGGSYTLGEADGITDAIVWKVDGNLVTAGTHAVTTAGTHTVTAVPGDGHGFDFGIDNPSSWVLSFTAPQDCGDLTTLALPGETLASTGTDGGSVNLGLLFAGGLLMLGGALVIAEKRLKFGRK